MNVRRIDGNAGQPGRIEIVDDYGTKWEVPAVVASNGRCLASQNEYESDIGVEPSWELLGYLNLAVEEFIEGEIERLKAETLQ